MRDYPTCLSNLGIAVLGIGLLVLGLKVWDILREGDHLSKAVIPMGLLLTGCGSVMIRRGRAAAGVGGGKG